MGGLAPGLGGFELLVVALVALLVVGPRDLPLLMRKVGRALGKARAMANEFRASFDEMARQSELDELRKEVEALRTGQVVKLGPEADEAFKDIRDDLSRPLDTPKSTPIAGPTASPPTTGGGAAPAPASEPEASAPQPAETIAQPEAAAKPKTPAKPRAAAKPTAKAKPKAAGKSSDKATPARKATKSSPAKPRAPRTSAS